MTDCNTNRTQKILSAPLNDDESFGALRSAFVGNNPSYDLHYYGSATSLTPSDSDRVIFVQGPDGRTDEPGVGDILHLRAGEEWKVQDDVELDLLAFSLPEPLPDGLPTIIRPDWDENITDTPGGCATASDAYRRVLLTWKPEVGPYILHSLNAHRVRIHNSFSHYHPVDGGFDEFYLVQHAPEGARLLSSYAVPEIEARSVEHRDMEDLIQTRELHSGELIYIPRGIMHRGLGDALVQVITVPGFVPNAEIGLDHHLSAINEKLGLEGDNALPVHADASHSAVVK